MNIRDLRRMVRDGDSGTWISISRDTAEEMQAILLLLGCTYMPIIGNDDITVGFRGNNDGGRLVWIDNRPAYHPVRLTQFLDSLERHSEY